MQFPPAFKEKWIRLRRNNVAVALLLAAVLIIWLASGDFFSANTKPPEAAPVEQKASAFRVETERLQAGQHSPAQVVQGQLEPMRAVEIRSQIAAHLTKRLVNWGAAVKADQLLIQLNPEARAAELARAQANLALREAELKGGEVLFRKDLLSETEFLRLKAAAATARAERELNGLQLNYADIRAPFAGVVDQLPAEEGDYVQAGDVLATLVDISSLRLIAHVPQQQVYALQPGLEVVATLLDGTALPGTLTFVASLAESSTRSFRVEAHIDNPERRRIAGSSATLTIRLPEQQAHRLSPALLVLGDDGQVGVKSVDPEQKVTFLPVKILSFDPEGVWVGGLPNELEIITLGAGFVAAGDTVNPVSAEQR